MIKLAPILLLFAGVSKANNDECTSAMRLYENEPVAGDNAFAGSDFSDRDACGPPCCPSRPWAVTAQVQLSLIALLFVQTASMNACCGSSVQHAPAILAKIQSCYFSLLLATPKLNS